MKMIYAYDIHGYKRIKKICNFIGELFLMESTPYDNSDTKMRFRNYIKHIMKKLIRDFG